MNYFQLVKNDQSRSSWVLFDLVKPNPKKQLSMEFPPVMSKLFGPQPEGEMSIKQRYLPLCCKLCGRYEDDSIFDMGFEDQVAIRLKGDFGHTSDRVFVITDKLLKVIIKAKVQGFETKPIGKSGWHALRVTVRVGFSDKVIKLVKPTCKECGRAKTTKGMFRYQRQLSVPLSANTFFTTSRGWPSMLWDREIFMTEDVVEVLKKGGIKGGFCVRLLNDAEADVAEIKFKEGDIWWMPKNAMIRF